MKFYISIFFAIAIGRSYSQENKFIRHVQTDRGDQVEFRSAENIVVRVIDVIKDNKYAKLTYPSTTSSGTVKYKISDSDKNAVLSSFFLKASKAQVGKLEPSSLKAISDILLSEDHVVIADHLYMHGKGGGVLGVKSIATVFDKKGTKIAVLPENNDGYFSPAVSQDGKYLATNYGDVTEHTDYTLLPIPGFRLYDVKSGTILYDLQSSSEFDVLPPTSHHNMIIEVLKYPNSQYEYQVFKPGNRKLYKRKFSSEEIGRFVRFTAEGFVINRSGKEELIQFNKDFNESSF